MQRVFSADDLLKGRSDITVPVFVDTTSWNRFTEWAEANHRQLRELQQEGLKFWIFEDELSKTEPELYQRHLSDKKSEDADEDIVGVAFEQEIRDKLGVRFHTEKLPPETSVPYKTFLYEVQTIYFHDVTNREKCDRHAEFIFLTRRASHNFDKLRIMSAQPAFQRLVNAEIFLIPASPYKPTLPANFDIFTELQIHPKLRQIVEGDFRNGDYSKVVFQAVNAFRDFVREITGLTSDGGKLMDDALNPDYGGNPQNARKLPPLLVNNFAIGSSGSEANEQDGYYRFTQGIFKAIRNPNAHTTWTDPFVQSRFHDENTAIKVLCFLSLICERIDKPKRYNP